MAYDSHHMGGFGRPGVDHKAASLNGKAANSFGDGEGSTSTSFTCEEEDQEFATLGSAASAIAITREKVLRLAGQVGGLR